MKNLLLTLALLLPGAWLGGQVQWQQLNPMPYAAGWVGTVAWNGQIYLFGGAPTTTSATDLAYRYDPQTETFTPLPPLSAPRTGAGVVALNDKIYVIGGGTQPVGSAFADVFVFDPATEMWSTAASLPSPRSMFATAVLDGKIYVTGGGDALGAILNSTAIYDPATNSWSNGAAMPTGRGFVTGAVADGKWYVLGGLTSTNGVGLNTVEVFDPATGWSMGPSLPTARWALGATEAGNQVIAMGGSSWFDPIPEFNVVEVLNTTTGLWTTELAMPTARRALGVARIDTAVYTFGGITGFQGFGVASNVVERLDLMVATTEPTGGPVSGWLGANWPNPFRGSTEFNFYLADHGDVQIQLLDLQGRVMNTLLQQTLPPGEHRLTLRAGTLLPGVYLARLTVNGVDRGTLRVIRN